MITKYLLRIAAFALTFVFALGLIWFTGLFDFCSGGLTESTLTKNLADELHVAEDENYVQTSPNGKIEVRFKQFLTTEEGLAAEFEIVNKNTKTALYSAFPALFSADSSIAEEKTGYLSAYFKVDGKEQQEFGCENGFQTFELKSGATKNQIVPGELLSRELQKGDKIQVGFMFGFYIDDFKYFWSETLPLNDEIMRQVPKKRNQ